MSLRLRQERFCQEFIIDLNGTKAAIRSKYSKKGARVRASELLANSNIQKRIRELMDKREKRTEVTQDRVLKELALLGFSDLADLVEVGEDGMILVKKFEDMPKDASRLLKAIKEDRIIRETPDGKQMVVHDKIKYEIWDKPKALEMMGRHLGMFQDLGDKLVEVIYEISERFMPKKLNEKNK